MFLRGSLETSTGPRSGHPKEDAQGPVVTETSEWFHSSWFSGPYTGIRAAGTGRVRTAISGVRRVTLHGSTPCRPVHQCVRTEEQVLVGNESRSALLTGSEVGLCSRLRVCVPGVYEGHDEGTHSCLLFGGKSV